MFKIDCSNNIFKMWNCNKCEHDKYYDEKYIFNKWYYNDF